MVFKCNVHLMDKMCKLDKKGLALNEIVSTPLSNCAPMLPTRAALKVFMAM